MGLLSLALLPTAHADAVGDAWLARVDAATHVDQAHLTLEVTTFASAATEPAVRTLEIWQLGEHERLVRLTAPARLAGTGLLVTGEDTLHLFLPAYPPARRVVGSKRQSAFAGTDFAMEDLARLSYADDYEAVVVGPVEQGLTHLHLSPKEPDGEAAVDLWVSEDAVVRKVEHTDKRGRVSRRLLMSEIRAVDGVPLAHHLQVEDLLGGRKTVAELRAADLASPVSPELFTVTNLERP